MFQNVICGNFYPAYKVLVFIFIFSANSHQQMHNHSPWNYCLSWLFQSSQCISCFENLPSVFWLFQRLQCTSFFENYPSLSWLFQSSQCISCFKNCSTRTWVGLGGSVGCAVRLETRRSWVQPPPRSATFFHGDWSWNIFYGHSLPSADSRRAVFSFWRKNVHNTG